MQILEKRTYDRRTFDLNCTDLLADAETISSVTRVSADQGALSFGTAAVNTGLVTYPDGSTAAAGKAIQVQINDGTLPDGIERLLCTVRAWIVTNVNPRIEVTALLLLTDTPE